MRNCPKPLHHDGPHRLECCSCGIDVFEPYYSEDPNYYYYQPRNVVCGPCLWFGHYIWSNSNLHLYPKG